MVMTLQSIRRIFVIAVFFPAANAFADIPAFYGVDTVGSEALISGDYPRALQALWGEQAIADSGFWNFKKGVAHFNCKDYYNARACFLYCIKRDSLLSPAAYEYAGDIESLEKHPREAVGAYLTAQKDSLVQPDHWNAIRAKIVALVNEHPALVDSVPFLAAWRLDSARIKKEKEAALARFDALDSLVYDAGLSHIDSVLACFTDSGVFEDPCAALTRIEGLHLADSVFSTKRLFRFSKVALQCKTFERALTWLSKAMGRPDYGETIPAKVSLRHQALLEYSCGHYAQALILLQRYKSGRGVTPDILLTLARAYRNLGQDTQSLESYALFARMFPADPMIAGVLWNLALENDQRGNYHTAITYYRKVSALKKNGARGSEALLRIGLCYYKAGEYAAACSSFAKCSRLYPDAPSFMASLYWKACGALARHEKDGAKKQFIAVIHMAPTDYYAFRAREALTLTGDTALIPVFDTVRDAVHCRNWLDSLSSPGKEKATRADSCLFECGKKLVFAGCPRIAQYYLEPLESSSSSNFRMQFDLALLYKTINNPAASFRVGRKLTWRIPQKDRSDAPVDVYMLAYPLAFFDNIKQAAAADTVDPFLVLGVMRQESVFNPSIVSRAGAIGLMQLMPSTAKAVAAELSEPFFADSLTRSRVNIRYGTHYLKKLLDQFHGNMVQAIAGYNGGPPAIMRWFEKNKSKTFDLFIEDIGYEETRGYVKKVLANYWTYTYFARITGN
jgi:soluble lytic murein transglycosylase-like protein/Tfp pilus assembly protein PilF